MIRTIWLMTEGETEKPIIEAILAKKGIQNIRVKQIGDTNGGISRLAQQIEKLILSVLEDKNPQDCILILHDADEQTQFHKDHHKKIEEVCKNYADEVFHLIACNAVEAWLLADKELCAWLGIKAQNQDGEKDPKKILERHLKNKNSRLKYNRRNLDKILTHIDGTGDKHSPSMRKGIQHLCK